MADDTQRLGRRRFMQNCAGLAGSAGVFGLLLATYSEQSKALPAWALRPPGALPEDQFNAACVRCGLCVRACPFNMLHLAELGHAATWPGAGQPVASLVRG